MLPQGVRQPEQELQLLQVLENQGVPKNIHLHIRELTDLVHPAIVQVERLLSQEHLLDQLELCRVHQREAEVVHRDRLVLQVRVALLQEPRKNSLL